MDIRTAISEGAKILRGNSILSANLDSEILMARVLNKDRKYILLNSLKKISDKDFNFYKKLINKRSFKKPVAQLTNKKFFWNSEFYVNTHTLIPRPETELIVEWVLDLSLNNNSTIFEVGTGSGCIAISICLKNKDLKILASDLSDSALEVAQINREHHNANNVNFVQSNWLACSMDSSLDLVISNPPYIKPNDPHLRELNHEPSIALTSKNGSQSFLHIASQAISSLKLGGKIIFEHGYSQAEEVSNILKDFGFENIVTCKDFQGLDRYTYANK